MKITPPGRAARRGPADYFTGEAWLDPLNDAPAPARANVALVSFAPGARTNWHTHPFGQTLYVVSGAGRAQTRGGAVQAIRPGDVIWFAPGEEHWHGAAPDAPMAHVAIQEKEGDGAADWLEPVADADYAAEPSS